MPPERHHPTRDLERGDYEEAGGNVLRRAVAAAWPLEALASLFVRELGEPWLNGKISGQGIRVGTRQMAHLARLNEEAAGRLGVRPPELFVVRGKSLETTLLGVGEQNTLALPSELLEAVDEDQLLFLLGREMGHIKSQNVVQLTLLRWVKEALGSAWKSLGFPVMIGVHAWRREATFSADRAGLLVGQALGPACKALLRQVMGNTSHLGMIDVEEYTRSGLREISKHPLKCAPELLEPEPYLPRRLARLHAFRAGEGFRALYPGLEL